MKPFVDEHRQRFGLEPICKALQLAASANWREAARGRDPTLCPPGRQRDAALLPAIERVFKGTISGREGELIHHCDRGSQYVSIRYSERLAQAGIKPSVGSKGDSYDNARAETINGLYKAALIHPWKTREAVH